MDNMVSHLDITTLFCAVDDFCQSFDKDTAGQIMLPSLNIPDTVVFSISWLTP